MAILFLSPPFCALKIRLLLLPKTFRSIRFPFAWMLHLLREHTLFADVSVVVRLTKYAQRIIFSGLFFPALCIDLPNVLCTRTILTSGYSSIASIYFWAPLLNLKSSFSSILSASILNLSRSARARSLLLNYNSQNKC